MAHAAPSWHKDGYIKLFTAGDTLVCTSTTASVDWIWQMSKGSYAAWALFILCNVATRIAGHAVWNIPLLVGLFGVSVMAGYWVVQSTGRKAWSVATVLIGLGVGQWPVILICFSLAAWSIRGFAP